MQTSHPLVAIFASVTPLDRGKETGRRWFPGSVIYHLCVNGESNSEGASATATEPPQVRLYRHFVKKCNKIPVMVLQRALFHVLPQLSVALRISRRANLPPARPIDRGLPPASVSPIRPVPDDAGTTVPPPCGYARSWRTTMSPDYAEDTMRTVIAWGRSRSCLATMKRRSSSVWRI